MAVAGLHRGRDGHRASFRRRVVLLPDPSGVSVQNVNNSTHALRPMPRVTVSHHARWKEKWAECSWQPMRTKMLSCHPLQTVQTTVIQSIPILRLCVEDTASCFLETMSSSHGRLRVSAMWWLPTKDLNVRKRSFENEVKVFPICKELTNHIHQFSRKQRFPVPEMGVLHCICNVGFHRPT